LQSRGSNDFTFGVDAIDNTGTAPVRIDAVRLLEPNGLELSGSFVVQFHGTLIGASSEFPPPALRGFDWSHRRDVGGAEFGPGELNLVTHLTATNPSSLASPRSTAGLQIDYTVDGSAFRVNTTSGLVIKANC
jgi:hypothetical protein